MANVQRPSGTEQLEVEIFTVTLDEGEAKRLLANPQGFTQELLGEDHIVNEVHLSKEIADGGTCSDRELLHVTTPGPYNSTHVWRCILHE